ncbi:MAG: DNA polymerase III subunit gamma/tau [Candidatus Limiplasma sp.]|nr:DNA polymerase III subunit gamma/tau [Candidatus Limiplasma sp.]
MAYQALYRQWRPTTFTQVIGQEAVVKTLRRQIETGHIAHAYLFCGCRGTGKTTLAKLMSRAVNCQNPQQGDPCGQCPSCQAILSETTLDVLELDAASNNSVDHVRELLEQVRYPAQTGKYKVYIIDEVHMLSTAAFNALLKTLEEPPAHVVFILATTEPQKLPATILSRVQRYDFRRIPSSLMVERMKLALDKLGITAQEEALQMVARAAEGAMRDAFSILDMCVAGAVDGAITAAQVRDVLGSSDKDFLFAFVDCIAARDMGGVMERIDLLMRSGREPQVFLRELTAHVRALLTVKAVSKDAAALLDVTDEDEKRYRSQGEAFSQQRLLRIMELLMRAEGELRYASTPRIGLEVAALDACQEPQGEDNAALLERLSEAERKLEALTQAVASGAVLPGASGPAPKAEGASLASESPKPAPASKEGTAPEPKDRKSVVEKLAKAASSGEDNDPAAIWQKALAAISKTEPPLFGLLRAERFLGAKGNAYQLLIPFAKKDFTYLKLSQPARIDMVSKALSEAAGMPLVFQPVLEGDLSSAKKEAVQDQVQSMLVETFGRDLVQIDDEEDPR